VGFSSDVFINVPFDQSYAKLFRALSFTVAACGLRPRCALEGDDGSTNRLDKIYRLIEESRFGIHDLSRTGLDAANRLPRFNMPLELGIFLGAKRFGDSKHGKKTCLILDRERYRFQKYCSDISGQDIRAHENNTETAIRAVRDWLRASLSKLPGSRLITDSYVRFRRALPEMCSKEGLHAGDLTFLDYRNLIESWTSVEVIS
jgi:hypothetical protein